MGSKRTMISKPIAWQRTKRERERDRQPKKIENSCWVVHASIWQPLLLLRLLLFIRLLFSFNHLIHDFPLILVIGIGIGTSCSLYSHDDQNSGREEDTSVDKHHKNGTKILLVSRWKWEWIRDIENDRQHKLSVYTHKHTHTRTIVYRQTLYSMPNGIWI